jgi:acyl-coenzyme A synthetase/AMP-(fatty) acid ligase
MHGTGAIASFGVMTSAGCTVTLEERRFSAVELLDTIEREGVKSIAIVGEAHAQPILAALDAEPGRWDISSLRMITSSGVMWSPENKAGLLRHNPRLMLVDTLGSSEAVGMANSVTSATSTPVDTAEPAGPPRFVLSESTRVITENGRFVEPGSGESGLIAHRGRVPLGYYKDEAKSAATFKVIDGARWSMPGDHATVDADGTLRLLGRGSQCINTGGEKVYPEEPEEALRSHPDVVDAACVGLPDPRFGQRIVALVHLHDGVALDEPALIAHVKGRLAHYKAPKQIFTLPTLGRAANGKLDYKTLRDRAEELQS